MIKTEPFIVFTVLSPTKTKDIYVYKKYVDLIPLINRILQESSLQQGNCDCRLAWSVALLSAGVMGPKPEGSPEVFNWI